MLHIFVRQAKVNISLHDIIHSKVVVHSEENSNIKASVSSIDITSTATVNLIEFNSSCELFNADGIKKLQFSLFVTEKQIENIQIGSGSCLVLPSDHGSTKFVYLYDFNDKSKFIATLTYTVFFHSPPMIEVAEKNFERLRKNVDGVAPRVPSSKELSFLYHRRLNWMNRGSQPASFDYKTEKHLDRVMMMTYGRQNRDKLFANQHQNKIKRDKINRLEELQFQSASMKPNNQSKNDDNDNDDEENIPERKTQMKVGYVGVAWPDINHYNREKILMKLYLAEERRLKAMIEKSQHAAKMNKIIPNRNIHDEKILNSLLNILDRKESEIKHLRKVIIDDKQKERKHKNSNKSLNNNNNKDINSYEKDTQAFLMRRLSNAHSHNPNIPNVSSIKPSSSSPVQTRKVVVPIKRTTRVKQSKQMNKNNNKNTKKKSNQNMNESVDTNVLVDRFNDALSNARTNNSNVNDEEELDDTLEEYSMSIANNEMENTKSLRNDWLHLAHKVIDNLSDATPVASSPSPIQDKNIARNKILQNYMNESSMDSSRHMDSSIVSELIEKDPNVFANELEDVKERVESLSAQVNKSMTNSAASTPISAKKTNRSLYHSPVSALYSSQKRPLKPISSIQSKSSDGKSNTNKFTNQSEKALLKSMDELKSILARLQQHESLLSTTSTPLSKHSKMSSIHT